MAVSFKTGFWVSSVSVDNALNTKKNLGVCSSMGVLRSKAFNSPALKNEFKGRHVLVSDLGSRKFKGSRNFSICAQALCVSRAMRWWDKTLKSNMIEITSGQQLVDTLVNAGGRLVIIDFYSPGCGGCKALHPKICQFAEMNPNALFLKVNYEELKPMCHSLNIHVLPFFRFYRGAEGRVCSFSCTNATIKKFRDALAKHGNERCSLGPAKGLDESELLKLASNGEISLDFPLREERRMNDFVYYTSSPNSHEVLQENTAVLV